MGTMATTKKVEGMEPENLAPEEKPRTRRPRPVKKVRGKVLKPKAAKPKGQKKRPRGRPPKPPAKRPVGRPRKHPVVAASAVSEEASVKRPVGRPRKTPGPDAVGSESPGTSGGPAGKARPPKLPPRLRQTLKEQGLRPPARHLKNRPWTEQYAEAVRQAQQEIVSYRDQAARNQGYSSWRAVAYERRRINTEIKDLRKEIVRAARLRDYLERIKAGEPLPALPDRSGVRMPRRKKASIGRLPRYMPEVDESVPFELRQADDPNAPHFDPRQADQQERALRLAYGGMIRDLRVDTLQESVYDVAPRAYLDPNRVADYERGVDKASFSEMSRIARAVNLTGEQLLIRWLEALTGRQVTLVEADLPETAGAGDQSQTVKAGKAPRAAKTSAHDFKK